MNIDKLKAAEAEFMAKFPLGFESPEMLEIGKKHKMDKMETMAKAFFSEERFSNTEQIIEDMIKVITRSSLVSVFEKPKFRDFVRSIRYDDKEVLASGLYEIIHGDMEKGYEMSLAILEKGKLAKWTIITVCPMYYRSSEEVFVKPTTTKGIIKYFDIEDMKYYPRPSYDFYIKYKALINHMKEQVNDSLKVNNPAFTGFLMISME